MVMTAYPVRMISDDRPGEGVGAVTGVGKLAKWREKKRSVMPSRLECKQQREGMRVGRS